jgi:hypothetical protein
MSPTREAQLEGTTPAAGNCQAYYDWLQQHNVIKQVNAAEIATNALIDGISTFDAAALEMAARAYAVE